MDLLDQWKAYRHILGAFIFGIPTIEQQTSPVVNDTENPTCLPTYPFPLQQCNSPLLLPEFRLFLLRHLISLTERAITYS